MKTCAVAKFPIYRVELVDMEYEFEYGPMLGDLPMYRVEVWEIREREGGKTGYTLFAQKIEE